MLVTERLLSHIRSANVEPGGVPVRAAVNSIITSPFCGEHEPPLHCGGGIFPVQAIAPVAAMLQVPLLLPVMAVILRLGGGIQVKALTTPSELRFSTSS